MAADEKIPGQSLFRGVLLAHLIIVLHIVLIGLLAGLILVIGGLARYGLWIAIAVGLIGIVAAFLLYRRRKAGGGTALSGPARQLFEKSGNVEVRFLGGLLSFQFREPDRTARLTDAPAEAPRLLEGPPHRTDQEMAELVHLLATDQITREEYHRARKQILDSRP